MKSPAEIVQGMLNNDAFSQLLGMEIKELELGYCQLSCPVTAQTTNGFGIAHGGLTYSLADSALAFAANSRGNQCVSIDTQIAHIAKVQLGDHLTATCKEIHRGKRTGVYEVHIENQNNKLVAYFKGTVFISEQLW
ncbi:MAG: PaaI family thioesterase [Flavobacteriales bacterium]